MLLLHQTGTPLARTQGELTYLQRSFLQYALAAHAESQKSDEAAHPRPRPGLVSGRARLARVPRR